MFLEDYNYGCKEMAFADTAYYKDDKNWDDGVLYIENYLIRAEIDINSNYAVKVTFAENSELQEIGESAFGFCRSLSSISIPPSVKTIGGHVFSETGLSSIVLPEGLRVISGESFKSCSSLTEVTIPKNCKKGTYKITVKAAGNKNYNAGTKTVTIKVK